jgi:hypothetical protein
MQPNWMPLDRGEARLRATAELAGCRKAGVGRLTQTLSAG